VKDQDVTTQGRRSSSSRNEQVEPFDLTVVQPSELSTRTRRMTTGHDRTTVETLVQAFAAADR